MTYSPGNNRKTTSHAEKKKNRLNIQSVHAPKPVKKTLSRAAKKAAQGGNAPPAQKINRRKNIIITVASITVVVMLIAALVYYLIAIVPMQRILLTVGDENVSTGYFLKRTVANSSGNVSSTLQLMEAELIIKQQAASQGVTPATTQDIDDYLRKEAITSLSSAAATDTTTTTATTATTDTTTTSSTTTPTTTTPTTISDSDFNKWFKQQLDITGLSAKEYRDVAGREIQRQRLTAILTADIPASIKQIHLWAIVYNSSAAATAAKAKIDGGEDWSTAAAAAATALGSTNNTTGDLGWWPEDAIDSQLVTSAKNLENTLNVCSDPIAYQISSSTTSSGTTTSYVLLKVSEISADPMPVTDAQKTVLQNNALNNWLNTKASGLTITFHGLNGSTTLDSQTSTWLNYQVQRLIKKRPTETTTTVLSSTTTTTTPTTSTTTSTTTGTSP